MRTRRCLALMAALLCLAPGWARGQTLDAQPLDPKAEEALRKMSRALQEAQAFRFQARVLSDVALKSGQLVQLESHAQVALQRPNRLYMDVDGDEETWAAWYNGETFTALDRQRDVYVVVPAPPTLDGLFAMLDEEYGLALPFADLLVEDPYPRLTQEVRAAVSLGVHQVDAARCHHLAFSQALVDWQVWVDTSEKALPRQFMVTVKNEEGLPRRGGSIYDWDLQPALADDVFEASLPAGVREVALPAFLDEAAEGQDAGEE